MYVLVLRSVVGLFLGLVICYGAAREALAGEWLDAAIAGALGATCLAFAITGLRRLRRSASAAWRRVAPPAGAPPVPRDPSPADAPPPPAAT